MADIFVARVDEFLSERARRESLRADGYDGVLRGETRLRPERVGVERPIWFIKEVGRAGESPLIKALRVARVDEMKRLARVDEAFQFFGRDVRRR